jgi:deazaflavin-dependent oxidoreductase (nitroreductase family)
MSTTPADFNDQVIEEFRTKGGKAGGIFEGMSLLLLHNVGAKSGERYVTPLVYMPDGERWVIFASKGGAPKNPGWYWNLKAGPEVAIEVGTDTVEVLATEATGEERDRLFDRQKSEAPQFAEYEQKTERTIPVIVLTRRG